MIKIKMPNWEIFAVHVWSLLLFIVILSVLALIGSVLVVLLEPCPTMVPDVPRKTEKERP